MASVPPAPPANQGLHAVIYLDNSATSCPKPPAVVEAVTHALVEVCASPGRGAYDTALEAGRIMLRARRVVATLFGIKEESRVIFTLNATLALNLALKGILAEGGHVVTSSLEHNAMVRPLAALARTGVTITRVPCAVDGTTDPDDILAAVRPDTKLVALTHASNVLGTLMPVELVGPALRERGVPLLVDAAQTAGGFAIDVEAACIDLLAVPDTKGCWARRAWACCTWGREWIPVRCWKAAPGVIPNRPTLPGSCRTATNPVLPTCPVWPVLPPA
jgi:cysteine desulfurase/selenocysteine lyase